MLPNTEMKMIYANTALYAVSIFIQFQPTHLVVALMVCPHVLPCLID